MADDGSTIASSSRPATPTAKPNVPTAGPSAIRQPIYRFAWDSPSRRVGPGSVADTVDSRADFLSPPVGANGVYGAGGNSQNLNFSSLSLAAAAIPPDWSSAKYGLNAISTVLNNPRKKGDPPKAHAPVPPVKPAILPRVKRKDFDGYLRAVAPEWERYQKNKQTGQDGNAQLRQDDARLLRAGKEIPPLESVPAVYFDSPFDLTSPTTFAQVVEQEEGGELLDPSALSHSLPLLEKMSHYADTIELHLIREISERSSSFFEALSNLQDLQTESEQCLDRISRLREMLTDVDEKGAKRGLELVRLQKRLENLQEVREGVKVVENAGETMSLMRGLVSGGDWGEALNFIDGLREACATPDSGNAIHPQTLQVIPPPRASSLQSGVSQLASVEESEEEPESDLLPKPSINLASLRAFSSLPTQLQSLSLQISSALINDLVLTFRTSLHTSSDRSQSGDSGAPDLQVKLTPMLQGLLRTKSVKNGLIALRGVTLDECQNTMKEFISIPDPDVFTPEDSEGNVEEFTPAFTQHIQTQAQPDFTRLMFTMFESLLRFLRRLQSRHSLILDVIKEQNEGHFVDLSLLEAELEDSLSDVSELANLQTSRVLNLRAEQHATLDLPSFFNLFETTWNFVVSCEVICRKMFVGLRGAILAQSKEFLSAFHAQRHSLSAKVVEEEMWAPVEVNKVNQDVVNMLVDGAVQDPACLKLAKPMEVDMTINGSSTAPSSPNGPAKPATGSKFLHIENRTFYAVGATLQVLSVALDYIKVIVNLPVLTLDTMSRMVELLKAFNSRTCQVVLGAGAMRSAGLKNITAKHLALASQSLSIMIALVPYIRETFRRHLNSKQAVMLIEFDKLKRDYQEHQNEIHDKLIAIMGDRISFHCKTLAGIDWSKISQQSSTPLVVNEYMEHLIKETATLGKVLSRYLPEPPVEYIMSQIFAAINHSLEEEYGKIDLPNERAKEILLNDVRFLKAKISALKGVGNTSGMGMLELIVSEKRPKGFVAPSRVSSPPASPPSVTSANSAPPPTSSPPPQTTSGIGTGLPSNIRRSPFAGNKRISSLLSSVTSIGRVADKADSGKLPVPAEKPVEKAPLVEEPESIPISSSDISLAPGDRSATPDDPSNAQLQAESNTLGTSPGSAGTPTVPSSPPAQNATAAVPPIPEEKASVPNGPVSGNTSPPTSEPPAVPPKLNLSVPSPSSPPPPSPNKDLPLTSSDPGTLAGPTSTTENSS